MTIKKEIIRIKKTKSSRSYDEKFRIRVVQEITSGLLSRRAAALKYVINRKTVDNYVTSLAHNNMRPMDIAKNAMMDTSEEPKVRVLSKQVVDLTKKLEKAKLTIVGLQTIIEVSEQDLNIKILKKPGAKQSKD
jgi:transposase-like protein